MRSNEALCDHSFSVYESCSRAASPVFGQNKSKNIKSFDRPFPKKQEIPVCQNTINYSIDFNSCDKIYLTEAISKVLSSINNNT